MFCYVVCQATSFGAGDVDVTKVVTGTTNDTVGEIEVFKFASFCEPVSQGLLLVVLVTVHVRVCDCQCWLIKQHQ